MISPRSAGVHPRIGATDVISRLFLSAASLWLQCALLARQAGLELIWTRYNIPIYFYEAAASRPDRALLEQVRQGQFEGLRELVLRDAARRPDLGGPRVAPHRRSQRSGSAANSLIAYNLYLDRPDVSRRASHRSRRCGPRMADLRG